HSLDKDKNDFISAKDMEGYLESIFDIGKKWDNYSPNKIMHYIKEFTIDGKNKENICKVITNDIRFEIEIILGKILYRK
ncbi:TPA: hypothetical protein RKI06_001415, partial [Pasteurella multocida]|nr:hypothetical protein [Pasteurella multocida]